MGHKPTVIFIGKNIKDVALKFPKQCIKWKRYLHVINCNSKNLKAKKKTRLSSFEANGFSRMIFSWWQLSLKPCCHSLKEKYWNFFYHTCIIWTLENNFINLHNYFYIIFLSRKMSWLTFTFTNVLNWFTFTLSFSAEKNVLFFMEWFSNANDNTDSPLNDLNAIFWLV